jgi:hypothetical protein
MAAVIIIVVIIIVAAFKIQRKENTPKDETATAAAVFNIERK